MSSRSVRVLTVALLLPFMVYAPQSPALTRSVVKVRLAFAARHPYASGFTPEERQWISDEVMPCIATLLSTKLHYLDFKIDTGDHELLFELGDKNPTPSPNIMREVGFWIAADEEVTREDHQAYVVYRTRNEFGNPLPRKEGLAAELEVLLKDYVNRHHTDLVTLLSRSVTIGNRALPLDAPEWALPFTHKDLSIENSSEFRIVADRPGASAATAPAVVEEYELWAVAKGFVAPSEKVAPEWHESVVARTSRVKPEQPSPLTPDRFAQLVARNIYVTLYHRPPGKPVNRKLPSCTGS